MEILIALAVSSGGGSGWNYVTDSTDSIADLVDTEGNPTGISLGGLSNLLNGIVLSAGGQAGSGDAAWVPDWANVKGRPLNGTTSIVFGNLTNGEPYTIEAYGLASVGTRIFEGNVDGGTTQSYDEVNNYTQVLSFVDETTADGDLTLNLTEGAGSDGTVYGSAIRIMTTEEVAELTVTQTELVPGAEISGSYTGFPGVPTSPLSLTDKRGNGVNVSVSISDNGDGTGTFSGTVPADVNLLYGDVDVELS